MFNIISEHIDILVPSWHKYQNSAVAEMRPCSAAVLQVQCYVQLQWAIPMQLIHLELWLISFPKSVPPPMLHTHPLTVWLPSRMSMWLSSNSLCCVFITLSPYICSNGDEYWWSKHVLTIKTKSHYKLPHWPTLPMSLPLHINLSPEKHLTNWLTLVPPVACYPHNKCNLLPNTKHKRYRLGNLTYWICLAKCANASDTLWYTTAIPNFMQINQVVLGLKIANTPSHYCIAYTVRYSTPCGLRFCGGNTDLPRTVVV
jgi:hypothetical protein